MTAPSSMGTKRDVRRSQMTEPRGLVCGAPHTLPDEELFSRPYVQNLLAEIAALPEDVAPPARQRRGDIVPCAQCGVEFGVSGAYRTLYCGADCRVLAKRKRKMEREK